MATPTFVAEDADSLYMRILQYEIQLIKEKPILSKERIKEIENNINNFYTEYNKIFESLREFKMQERIDAISGALHRLQGIATMRWFLNNSNSNSGLNTNSNNNMEGGRKSRKTRKTRNTRKTRKPKTKKSRKYSSKK